MHLCIYHPRKRVPKEPRRPMPKGSLNFKARYRRGTFGENGVTMGHQFWVTKATEDPFS